MPAVRNTTSAGTAADNLDKMKDSEIPRARDRRDRRRVRRDVDRSPYKKALSLRSARGSRQTYRKMYDGADRGVRVAPPGRAVPDDYDGLP
jgi:hypothetical protein